MEKSKFYIFIATTLLISNLVLVGYIFNSRNNRPPIDGPKHPGQHRGPRDLIIKRLHFSDAQITAYDKLIQWHRGEIDNANEQMMSLKNQLYATLAASQAGNAKDSLLSAIASVQQKIEQTHYKHFEDIRDLCTADQKKDFEELTREIAFLFAPSDRKPHRP